MYMKQHLALIYMILGAFCASSIVPISVLYTSQELTDLFNPLIVPMSYFTATLIHLPLVLTYKFKKQKPLNHLPEIKLSDQDKLNIEEIVQNKMNAIQLSEAPRIRTRRFAYGVLFIQFGFALFAYLLVFSQNPYSTTMIFALFPLGMILISAKIPRGEKFTKHNIAWLIVGISGLAVILVGPNIPDLELAVVGENRNLSTLVIEVIKHFVAVFCLSIGTLFITTAINNDPTGKGSPEAAIKLSFGVLLFMFFCSLISSILVYFLTDKSIDISIDGVLYAGLYGFILFGLSTILFYSAISLSKDSSINAVWYMTPVFGVIWLLLLGKSGFHDFIALGAILIVVANIMLYLTSEAKASYKITIISTIVFGFVAYFTGGQSIPSYFDAVSAPVIFFALIFGFVADRMLKRSEREKQILVELLNDEMLVDLETAEIISEIAKTSNLSAIRVKYRKILNGKNFGEYDLKKLNSLIISKMESISTTEMFVILITAVLSILTATFGRPEGFIYDSFSMIVSTAVVFLTSYIFDLYRSRRTVIFSNHQFEEIKPATKVAEFVISSDALREPRDGEKMLVVGLLVFVMFIFHGLFLYKYAV